MTGRWRHMLRLYISGLIQIPIVTHRRSACGDDAIDFRDSLHAYSIFHRCFVEQQIYNSEAQYEIEAPYTGHHIPASATELESSILVTMCTP